MSRYLATRHDYCYTYVFRDLNTLVKKGAKFGFGGPALDGVVERLKRGARVADIGCGHGASTIVMAQAFPKSSFIGLDYYRPR